MKLSILICTIECRAKFLDRLLARLKPQLTEDVEVLIAHDDADVSIGEKRNVLMASASGDYVCFVDDDDMLAQDYVARILAATDLDPDCIGFVVKRTVDGRDDTKPAIHSLRFKQWGETERNYERTPNHLNPIRRSIASGVKFADKDWGEDRDYSQRVTPLLKSEVFINAELYIYEFRTRRTEEKTHAKTANVPGR